MHTQAWFLRRLMSMYNDVCRRPHLPREPALRRILSGTGVDLSLYGPASAENLEKEVEVGEGEKEEEEEEGGEGSECPETEQEEEDPCPLES